MGPDTGNGNAPDGAKPASHMPAGGLAGRMMAIGSDCAQRLKTPHANEDHGDLLYSDKGLPIQESTP
jgi:hypothetical protein